MARYLLTDAMVRKAKPRAKSYRLFDGDGLALRVSPTGAKSWQFRYRLNGEAQTLTIGKYDTFSLADARERADKARKLAADGVHLTVDKRVRRLRKRAETATLFEGFAERWIAHEARRLRWSPDYRREVEQSVARHLQTLHPLPLVEITAPAAAAVLREVERATPIMAEKVRRRLRRILDFAVEEGLLPGNPLPARRRGPKVDRRHFPAVTDRAGVGEILRNARASDPAKGIARAHLLTAFTAQRIAGVVGAHWDEFDLESGVWSIPRSRMKIRDAARGPHKVPIPRHLLAELKQWHETDGPGAPLVCPGPRDAKRPVTPEGVEKHYRDALGLAGKHSPHSWRSAFKTICAEAGKDSELVEAQLDHVVGSKVASAYDRATRLELRRKLIQWYESVLLSARDADNVVALRAGSARP